MEELEFLEREIEKLGRELNIEEKHIKRFFDETYTSISLTKRSKEKRVVLLSHIPQSKNGKVNNPIIKSVREENHEAIKKMEKLVRLIRAYRGFKKAKEIKERVREELSKC